VSSHHGLLDFIEVRQTQTLDQIGLNSKSPVPIHSVTHVYAPMHMHASNFRSLVRSTSLVHLDRSRRLDRGLCI